MVLGPVSEDETLLLTFVYEPAAAPLTVTLIVQEPLAASVPPEREIVLGAVVVNVPVVHAVVELDTTVSPAGKTSLKETFGKDVVVFGLVMVNVRTLVVPVPMEVGAKLFERFGTVGRGQPVMSMLSKYIVAVAFCAPAA